MPRKFDKNRRNRDLIRKYGITEDEYNVMLAQQRGVCKICNKPPTGRALHTDHDHKLVHYKVKTTKLANGWLAQTNDDLNRLKLHVEFVGKTKSEAIKAVKHALLRLSVRSLICWGCNSLLRWGGDSPQRLRNAAKYLEEFDERFR